MHQKFSTQFFREYFAVLKWAQRANTNGIAIILSFFQYFIYYIIINITVIDDDNTGISHVFELPIGMNELDHCGSFFFLFFMIRFKKKF